MTKRKTTAQGGIEVEELIESTKDDVGKNQGIHGNGQQPPFDTDVDERSGQHIPLTVEHNEKMQGEHQTDSHPYTLAEDSGHQGKGDSECQPDGI